MKKRIAIDIATIYPGKGGSGGGIWTYAKNVLAYLDKQDLEKSNLEITVFVNKEFSEAYSQIKINVININTQGVFLRLLYVHFVLPFLCYKKEINILHKLATEVPVFIKNNLVVTVHDFMTEFYIENNYQQSGILQSVQQTYFSWITKHAIKNANVVVTPSNAVNQEVRKRFNKDRVVTTELGCFINEKKPQLKITSSSILIYYVAGFYPHKGHLKAIELFEILLEEYKLDAKLIFRGHVSSKEYYEKVVNKSSNSKYSSEIQFENYTQKSTIEEMYQKANFLMLLSEYEGFGLPILEAQTMRIPVIASNIQVIREVSNGYGCLIDANHIKEEAKKVYQFIIDKHQLNETIELGYNNAANFSWDENVKKLLNVYEEV